VSDLVGPLLGLAVVGVVSGLVTLVRGLGGYRRLLRLEGFGSSLPRSVAVGEARLSGTVEAAEVTLVSPLQSQPCVYYRASVDAGDGRSRQRVFSEERGVGFRVRSETGSIRVFPGGAQWDVPDSWSGTDLLGDPPGLELRTGPASTTASGLETRDQAVADLLTVHRPADGAGLDASMASAGGRRSYREARLSVGDAVTVIGMVLPFDQLPDPGAANEESGAAATDEAADAVVAADLAAARAAGGLADSTSDAWGNAAIEGFGIDRPVREPVLDPAAQRPELAPASEGAKADVAFDIAPETLIVAAAPGVRLLIAAGAPSGAESRNEWNFVTGLAGAVLAIVSAIAVVVLLSGTWP
jgi:hypothetical protein